MISYLLICKFLIYYLGICNSLIYKILISLFDVSIFSFFLFRFYYFPNYKKPSPELTREGNMKKARRTQSPANYILSL